MCSRFYGVAYRNRGFDDHHRLRVDAHHILNHRFDRTGIEVVGLGIVVGWCGDDDVIRPGICFALVQRGLEIEFFIGEVILDLGIFDRRLLAVKHRNFFGNDIDRDHFIVLGKQDGVGEADVAGSGDGDFH